MTKDRGFLIFVLDVNSSPDMGMLKASGFRLGRERGVVCILLSVVPSSHRLSLALQVSIGSYVMQIPLILGVNWLLITSQEIKFVIKLKLIYEL